MDKSKRKTLGILGSLLPAYTIGRLAWAVDGVGRTATTTRPVDLGQLAKDFVNPPNSSRPGAYWCWLDGDMTKEAISYDLEEMKDKGMSRAEIWDVAIYDSPENTYGVGSEFLGDQSTELIKHALSEGKRLGLTIGMVASSGWNAGGSWVEPDWAAKGLYTSELKVNGGRPFKGELPFPKVPDYAPKDENGMPVYSREITVLAIPDNADKEIKNLSDIVRLNNHYDGKTLGWDVPEGDWVIVRVISSNTGQYLIVPSPNSDGLFIDFFDPEATKRHLTYILDRLGITPANAAESGLGYLEFDSMELDEATPWTEAMDDIFESHHGYDILPYLAVFAGWELPGGNDAFLYDFQKTISDQLIFSHYTTGSALMKEYGMDLVAEAGGPGPPIWDSCPVDALKALGNVSIPRGEFWVQNRHNIFLIKEVASASHIYGKGVVDAESFTTWRRWKDSPHALKKYLDRAFCEGLNMVTIHTFASSRPEHGLPGRAYHAGSDINTTATWWQQAKPFMDYMSRCSYLLRQGLFAADVAYYYGDKAPNFFPEYQKDPDSPTLEGLGAAYDFDVVNTDVILNRMEVKDGLIMLPDGMNYKLLVLPNREDIPDHVVAKVEKLIAQGANVLVQNPDVAGKIKGTVQKNITIDAALANLSISPDLVHDENKIDFIHRVLDGKDIYFVTNKTSETIEEDCTFRAAAKHVELWNAVTAERFALTNVKKANGKTSMSLRLAPYQSSFVVFTDDKNDLPGVACAGNNEKEVKGLWSVSFTENWGAPASIELADLISWTDHEDTGVRHFSGTASYRNQFVVGKVGADITLDLGEVRDVAEVIINGKSAGILWTEPFRLNIGDYVHAGENLLEVMITNMWVNRLKGDLDLPPAQRFCRTNRPAEGRFISDYGDEKYRVQKSGLIGPVTLETRP